MFVNILILCIFLLSAGSFGLLFLIYNKKREEERDDAAMEARIREDVRRALEVQSAKYAAGMDNSRKNMDTYLRISEERYKTFAYENNQKLDGIRLTIDRQLAQIRKDNGEKLDEMRIVVDEKLQRTINTRMNESFRLVNERLEQVYKGLGEMQTLASGVGDLKKVLTNVKARGILGEVQLGAILAEILAPGQYETNAVTKPGTRNFVEFAVKIPSGDEFIYLPIDSKFPGDSYQHLRDAYELGDRRLIDEAAKNLMRTIRSEAADIKNKYIAPPHTTDFAVMFLPFEGLYAEVINRGMMEQLQREYHVMIAGPSTMAALLNSLQMGFRSYALQQRSDQVWEVLGAVKSEFSKFEDALKLTQQRISQAGDELDKLVGVRTRQMQRKLSSITELEGEKQGVADDEC